MLRALTKVVAILVVATIGAYFRYWHGDAIRDAIHNWVANRALGTRGVDYANLSDPQNCNFRDGPSGQLVCTGTKSETDDGATTTTTDLPPRQEDLGTGWSGLAVSGARKSEYKELRKPDTSSQLVRADNVITAPPKKSGRSTNVHSTGAEIRYSPFKKSKRSKFGQKFESGDTP
jgi:hypothetical protein